MLHTKFRENRFLPYMDMGSHLGHVTKIPRTNFRYPYPWRLHIIFQLHLFQRRRSLKLWTDNGRMADHGYTISSPVSLRFR